MCRLFHLSTLLFLAVLSGCPSPDVAHQVLEQGSQAGRLPATPLFAVVTAEEQFSKLYREIHSGQLPPPQPPAIDFRRSILLVIAMGEQPTTGYSVEVGGIVRHGTRLEVEVLFRRPEPGRLQATVITRPFALVRVERQPGIGAVAFVDPEHTLLATVPLP